MYTDLSQEQIEQYQRDGCLVLDRFLEPSELEAMREAVSQSVEMMGRSKIAGDGNEEIKETDSYYDRVFVQRLNLWKINDFIRSFFTNPALGEMLCRLEGIDGIRIWHDQTLQKQPWGNPTAWHLDNPYWSFHSRNALSIWIALDDATLQNGCMYYLPGSHKIANFDNVEIGADMAALFDVYPAFRELQPVVGAMKAGMAGVHNGLTAHGAGANMTPHWRRAMTCAFMPVGATFNGNQNILSAEQAGKLKIGDLLNDETQTPLVWSRNR